MLASMLLENAGMGYSSLPANVSARYTAEDGAMLIAQESAMELYEIFSTDFIAMEEMELQSYRATMEGVTMEGVADNIKSKIKSAFNKIVEYLKKLRDKVLSFLANVRRHLDAIFMDGTAFVKKYEKDLMKLKNLAGYEKDGFNYTIDEYIDSIVDKYKSQAEKETAEYKSKVDNLGSGNDLTDGVAKVRKEYYETQLKTFLEKNHHGAEELSEVAEKWWSKLRDNAADKDSTTSIKCSNLAPFIKALKDSRNNLKLVVKADAAVKDVYGKAIKAVNEAASKADKKGNVNDASIARAYTGYISGIQSATNIALSQMYKAMIEREKFYKKVCVGAFTYKADK